MGGSLAGAAVGVAARPSDFAAGLIRLSPTLKTEKRKVTQAGYEERKSFFKFPSRAECRTHFEALAKSGPEIWET